MPVDTSEHDFEASIEAVLTGEAPPSGRTGEPRAGYGAFAAGGYAKRPPSAYDAASALLPDDVIEFILATQPETWQRLKRHVRGDVRASFLGRLRREVERRGTLSVLRHGLKDRGCHFKLCYFRPATARNPDLQRTYRANLFSLVRQVPFSTRTNETIDLGLFLNGLPLFTAELKNPFKRQTARDAVRQYKKRQASEPPFRFGRCLAHFAVGSEEVYMTTHLRGAKTRFLPFNQGSDGGKGNPPNPYGYRTSYLWEGIWSRDSVLNLVQHFIHAIDELDDDGTPTGDTVLVFPRYHQLRAVRRLVQAARRDGPGERYLVQHSAGSGKSISIATLAHQLAFLHDAEGRSVFDTVIVVTDRRVLDKQIAQVILQFERTRGVVADVKAGAKGLGRALAQGKRIVVVTLQTFPHVADAVRTSTGRRFAVIIDEAHSSQTGEYRKHLNDTLSARTLREAEGADTMEPGDLEDRIVAAIRTRGPQPNVSNFAFTATPKAKTLELFGEPQDDGTFEAFDVYAMRQAIEEGFILDVLQHQHSVQVGHQLA
jgi:type I restriction enzyme R subunit